MKEEKWYLYDHFITTFWQLYLSYSHYILLLSLHYSLSIILDQWEERKWLYIYHYSKVNCLILYNLWLTIWKKSIDICTTILLVKNNKERKMKRQNKNIMWVWKKNCSKIITKWLYKYHFYDPENFEVLFQDIYCRLLYISNSQLLVYVNSH